MRLPIASFRGYDRRVWILFVGRIVAVAGFSVVMPFLAIYLHNKLGVPMSIVGLIFLASASTGAMGQILGGEIADRFGRKKVMSVSIGARAGLFVMISLVIATNMDFVLIAMLVILSSFLGNMFEPASNAMIADIVGPGKRIEAYGLMRIGANIGFAIGPMIGGFIAAVSYSSLFLLTALTCAIVAVIITFGLQESMRKTIPRMGFSIRDLAGIGKNRRFMFFCAMSFLLFIVVAQMSTTYSVFSTDAVGVSEVEIGYLYTINGVVVVFLQLPMARYISRYRMSTVLAFGALVYAAGYFLVAFAQDFIFLAFCMFTITIGENVTSPSSMNIVANMSPENERGRYMGFFGLATSFGYSVAPVIGGVLLDAMIDAPFLLWGIIAMFGVVSAIGFLYMGSIMPDEYDRVRSDHGDSDRGKG
ncbi:MAG: MFS transporter [Methanomassiliicoccales archaeon]|nr:MFS transporter [Methanomassiliicoccales archaeon]